MLEFYYLRILYTPLLTDLPRRQVSPYARYVAAESTACPSRVHVHCVSAAVSLFCLIIITVIVT